MAFDFVKGLFSQRKPLPARRAYWRNVPLRRLTFLLLAIFLLFGMIGSFVDLLAQGQKPVVPVVVWSLFSGLIAVVWILAFFRNRRWLIGAIALWILGSFLISKLLHYLGPYAQPAPEQGTYGATVACMVLSFGAYVFFMRFIENEGTRAVRMQTELALAQGIQKTLVPPVEWNSPHLEIYGVSVPSSEVGGDLVDVVPLSDGSVFAYVADVSGHGLPAGILMGMIKTAVRTQLVDLPSPTAVFERLNQVLPDVKESHMYATCTALLIHPVTSDSCRVDFSIAGQPPMLHLSGKEVARLSDEQLPVGLLAGAAYRDQSVELTPGDVLLVATDGVVEAADKSGKEFGLHGLEVLLRHHPTQPLRGIARKIQRVMGQCCRQEDDQSLLLVRFTGAATQ
jgi:hypothetical protein